MPGGREFRAPLPRELTEDQRRIRATVLDGLSASQRALFDREDREGRLLGPFGLALLSPAIGGPSLAMGAAFRGSTVLTARGREIAILAVAAATRCSYERYAHAAVGRSAGLGRDEVAALLDGTFAGADEVEEAIHRVAVAYLSTPTGRAPRLPARAADVLDDRALYELLMLLGHYRNLAMAMGVFGVPAPE